jgi:hypothetical protein
MFLKTAGMKEINPTKIIDKSKYKKSKYFRG